MGAGYRTGKFTALLFVIILLFIFGLTIPLFFSPPTQKKSSPRTLSAPSAEAVNGDGFVRAGYIVETAEGRAVLYEESGGGATRKNLIINPDSFCDFGEGGAPCSLPALPSGMKVRISGIPSGESSVIVRQIEIIR